MLKILIAEDEEPIANLIRMNLKKAGYECECALDGEEAADRMENGHYDLLLLDILSGSWTWRSIFRPGSSCRMDSRSC